MLAIETEYEGTIFRSRVEARWAVFFRTLEIRYEYEREGFELPSGRYLPDFWLPDHGYWIEIKGQLPKDDGDELRKCRELAIGTNANVFLFAGPPGVTEKWPNCQSAVASMPWVDNGVTVCSEDHGYWWCECFACGAFGITFNGRADRLPCKEAKGCKRSDHGDKGYNYDSPRLMRASHEANTYRFWNPR